MKEITIIIVKYSGILFVLFLTTWWMVFSSPFNVPELIPHTPIKTYGLFLGGFILTVLILSQKAVLKKTPEINIVNLTLAGAGICFINEVVFQFILLLIDNSHYYIRGVLSTTIVCAILSFFVAFQLKTKRSRQLLLLIIVFLILFKILTQLFPIIIESS